VRQLIATTIAELLVLFGVNAAGLLQDLARELLVIAVGVLGGVGVHLGPVDRDHLNVHKPGLRAQFQHVAEQRAQRPLVALAKARDRRVIRRLVGREDADRDVLMAAPLDPPRGPFADRVGIDQQRHHHRLIVRRPAPAILAIAGEERPEIHRVDGTKHEPRQVILRQPLAQARRQQQLLLAIARDEVLRHPEMLLTTSDGPLVQQPPREAVAVGAAPGRVGRVTGAVWSQAGEGERRWFVGTLATIRVPGESVDDRFALIEFLFPRFASPPRHTHPQDESYVVIDGLRTVEAAGERFALRPGGTAVVPMGVAHTFRVDSETACVLVLSTPGGLERLIRDGSVPATTPTLPPADTPRPSPEELRRLFDAHGQVNVGPPLSPDDRARRGARASRDSSSGGVSPRQAKTAASRAEQQSAVPAITRACGAAVRCD
jgi:quercetin dioxygenase-like cupin family protein